MDASKEALASKNEEDISNATLERFFKACTNLDIETIVELLPTVGIEAVDSEGTSIISLITSSKHELVETRDASSCPHVSILQFIKKHYPDAYARALNEATMAYNAAKSDCTILLDHLVTKEGCSLEQLTATGKTTLIGASILNSVNTMKYILETGKLGPEYRDTYYDMTPMLWAAYYLQVEAVDLLLRDPRNPSPLTQISSDNEDVFACIFKSQESCSPENDTCKHMKMLNVIEQYCSANQFKEALLAKSSTGAVATLHAASSECPLLLPYLKQQGCLLDEPDNDGDTPLTIAAVYGLVNNVKFFLENKCNIEYRDNEGKTPFLRACEGAEYEAAKMIAEAGADVTVKDLCENTGLHLVCAYGLGDEQVEIFTKFFRWLSDLEKCTSSNYEPMLQKLRNVNLSGHNTLLTLADSGTIKTFITLNEVALLKEFLSPVFRNVDGLNILHVYVAKHNFAELYETFNQTVFADLWDVLISEKVHQGPSRGYGCLHFACQAGNLDNINYLLEKYPERIKLKDRYLSGSPSPMDVLLKHRNEGLLSEIRHVTFHQLIESIDNVQKALNLRPADEAKMALLPLCEPSDKSVVVNPHTHKDEKYKSVRGSDGYVYPVGVKLFLMALKEDSTEIFRNIISLGLWSYLGLYRAAEDLNASICGELLECSDDTISKVLPDLHKGFGHYLKWRPKNTASVCFDMPAPSLLGIALRSGRLKIAKDLILLNQYHLLPTCLLVIEECEFLLKDGKALAESVNDVRRFAMNVALNAMDILDKSADEHRLQLLHKYIGGRFHPKECRDPDCFGPKFSSLGSESERTQFTLAIDCGSDEVVASDCFVRCSKTEWEQETVGQDTAVSPKTKFRIHSIAFVIFVCLFTYYVISIVEQTTWIDVVILLFAVSFALQEALQFFDTEDVMDYLTDGWNYLDIGGISLLLSALIWKLYEDAMVLHEDHYSTSWKYFIIRMLLSLSHMVWGFRFISFLRSFELVGPTINMIKTLLRRDLLPFLIIFFTICLSFGIFFFNLLNPDMRVYTSSGIVGSKDSVTLFSIMTRPLMTAFGNMDLGDIASCEAASVDWLKYNATAASIASPAPSCTHPVGTFHYRKYLLLPFLFLINLTMLNVLIAKFSMTVASQEDIAYMIWRRGDIELLNDYVDAPALPPPFTIFWVVYVVIRRLAKRFNWRCLFPFRCFGGGGRALEDCCYQPVVGDDGCEKHRSWWPAARMENTLGQPMGKHTDDKLGTGEEQELVAEIKEYLLYQACTFQGMRGQFTRARMDHGPAVEKLQIDIENLASASTWK